MPIVTPRTYIPILYTKRGELSALEDLASEINSRQISESEPSFTFDFTSEIIPLFAIQAIDWDFEIGEPKKDGR